MKIVKPFDTQKNVDFMPLGGNRVGYVHLT